MLQQRHIMRPVASSALVPLKLQRVSGHAAAAAPVPVAMQHVRWATPNVRCKQCIYRGRANDCSLLKQLGETSQESQKP